jgi:hypothetical protein
MDERFPFVRIAIKSNIFFCVAKESLKNILNQSMKYKKMATV